MAKVKAFESNTIQELEILINEWLREELKHNNHQVNIKNLSHCYNTDDKFLSKFTALLVYEYS